MGGWVGGGRGGGNELLYVVGGWVGELLQARRMRPTFMRRRGNRCLGGWVGGWVEEEEGWKELLLYAVGGWVGVWVGD